MSTHHLNAIVIGGGVTGTGVARDLALRGLNVALIEKKDFGAATTGASSGMIHGGLRYLLDEVETTHLSCLDSGYIQKIIPHLLFRIPFLMPIKNEPGDSTFKKIFNSLFLEGSEIFFEVYDRYQPLKNGKPSTRLAPEEALSIEPGLSKNIIGAVTMDEWGVDPFRLCLANAVDAFEHGAKLYTHTRVDGFIIKNGKVLGVKAVDELTGKKFELRADAVVNAAGPWVANVAGMGGAEVKIRPSKGVHLFYSRRISNVAIVCEAVDGRQVFMMPHENGTMIGTTDDDYYGDMDNITVTQDEIEYLLQAIEQIYPTIRQHRIIRTAAGIRPTLFEYGKYEDKLTRSHKLYDHKDRGLSGFFTITGGKLASYRAMSEETADAVCRFLDINAVCSTHQRFLPGGESTPDVNELAKLFKINPLIAARLIYRHGQRAERVLAMMNDEPRTSAIVCSCEPVIEAEIRYSIQEEHVRRLDDLCRRVRIGVGSCNGMQCAWKAAVIFAEEMGLSNNEMKAELEYFEQERYRERSPVIFRRHAAQEEIHQFTAILSH